MATPPGFADCSIQLVLQGFSRPAYITFGCDPVETDPNQIATELLADWLTAGSMNSRLDSTVTAALCTVRLGTDGGEDLIGTATSTAPGGLTGGAPPPNVAVLLHKRTARGGRRGRGRWYLPWFCSDNDTNEDGTLLPALISSVQTAANVMRTTMATEGHPMVILHSPGQTATGPPDLVTNITVANVVGTQRRRLGR